jgi:hypothetical protein
MYTFGDILLGDMFNTKSGRFVKTNENTAICVMSALHAVGELIVFHSDVPIILLWSCMLEPNASTKE